MVLLRGTVLGGGYGRNADGGYPFSLPAAAGGFGVGLPVNWEPGDDVLWPAPTTNEAMRKHGGVSPWFLKYKELSEREIHEKICKKHADKK